MNGRGRPLRGGPAGDRGRAVTVEFVPEEREFVAVNWLLARQRVRRRVSIFLCYAAALAAAAALVRGGTAVTVVLLALSAGRLADAVLAYRQPRKRLRDEWRSDEARAGDGGLVRRVTLDDEGYFNETPTASVSVKWRAFTHYGETPAMLLLYEGPHAAAYVPKRVLDGRQLQTCRELLREHIGRTEYRPPPTAQRPAFDGEGAVKPSPIESLEERQPPGA